MNGYCRDCKREWGGLAEAHCASCCEHFSNDHAFNRHLGPPDSDIDCYDPAGLEDREGRPALVRTQRVHGPVWMVRDDRPNPFVSDSGALPDSTNASRKGNRRGAPV